MKLPTKYVLEIYENSSVNPPCFRAESDTPFMPFSKGDFVHPCTWEKEVEGLPGVLYTVKSVIHRVWTIEGSHTTHQIEVWIEIANQP